jgi:hypothetical protein
MKSKETNVVSLPSQMQNENLEVPDVHSAYIRDHSIFNKALEKL